MMEAQFGSNLHQHQFLTLINLGGGKLSHVRPKNLSAFVLHNNTALITKISLFDTVLVIGNNHK